jgi:RecB family exonuclease
MAEATRAHPIAGNWFDPGRKNFRRGNELSMYVEPSADTYGLPIKGRLDRLEKTADGWMILDLKTTDDASPSVFQKKSFSMGYHIQAAFYTDLVKKVLDADNVEFIFCAMERRRPHGIALYKASEDMIEIGRTQYKKALKELSFCKSKDLFPGYDSNIIDLSLPGWANNLAHESPLF